MVDDGCGHAENNIGWCHVDGDKRFGRLDSEVDQAQTEHLV